MHARRERGGVGDGWLLGGVSSGGSACVSGDIFLSLDDAVELRAPRRWDEPAREL